MLLDSNGAAGHVGSRSLQCSKMGKVCNNTNTFVNEIVGTVDTVATVLTAEVVVNFEKSWYLKKKFVISFRGY